MIVGPGFLWIHVPKTGGLATKIWLQHLLRDHLFEFVGHRPIMHVSFAEAREMAPRQYRANLPHWMGFRRLAPHTLSLAMHMRRHGGDYRYRPPNYRGPNWMEIFRGAKEEDLPGIIADHYDFADVILDFFLRGAPPDVQFVRCEHLAEDVARMTGLTIEPESLPSTLTEHNRGYKEGRTAWRFDAQEFLGTDTIERLHARNPRWSELEHSVYGERQM